jgi:hypothetical protein
LAEAVQSRQPGDVRQETVIHRERRQEIQILNVVRPQRLQDFQALLPGHPPAAQVQQGAFAGRDRYLAPGRAQILRLHEHIAGVELPGNLRGHETLIHEMDLADRLPLRKMQDPHR